MGEDEIPKRIMTVTERLSNRLPEHSIITLLSRYVLQGCAHKTECRVEVVEVQRILASRCVTANASSRTERGMERGTRTWTGKTTDETSLIELIEIRRGFRLPFLYCSMDASRPAMFCPSGLYDDRRATT